MIRPFNPLMKSILNEELKTHPEKDKDEEGMFSILGQELLEKLWQPDEKPTTFWGKIKVALSDGIDFPQKLFDRMVDFRGVHGFSHKKEEMQRVMFYTTSSFRKGTEILARGCYLFHHNPQAFKKYATSEVDFAEDIRQSTFDEENVFMPALTVWPVGTFMATGETEQEYERAEDRRLPLLSFAPIKYGQHPSLVASSQELDKYTALFSEPSLYGFDTNPYRLEPLKKLLYLEQPESCYPSLQHKAIVIAINAFNRCLDREPVKICTHKENQASSNKQKTL